MPAKIKATGPEAYCHLTDTASSGLEAHGMPNFILLLLLTFSLAPAVLPASQTPNGCYYDSVPIKVKITSVKELISVGAARYEIRFEVLLTPDLPAKVENRIYGRDYQMLLRNKTFPGPLFLEKYGIGAGRIFDGVFNILSKGACKPQFFDFPDINLDDYSER